MPELAGTTTSLYALLLDDVHSSTGIDRPGHRLGSTRGPTDFDPIGVVGIREAEIKRQVALREVS